MKDIKTKDKSNIFIKTLDKSLIVADKTKYSLVITKEKVNSINNTTSQTEYGSEKIKQATRDTAIVSKKVAKREIKKAWERIRKTAKNTAKATKKEIKTTKKVAETSTKVAKQQIGNVGRELYWRWYGFDHKIEWCAVFVSWAANQAGLLNDKIPKFSGVANGIEWFKARGEWQNKGYEPRPGDIIFFDWEVDGKPNHVRIVEKVENGYIYTIKGNSTDDGCRAKKYSINSDVIYGFSLLAY